MAYANIRSAIYTARQVRRLGKRDGRSWRWHFWPPNWSLREPKAPVPPVAQTEPVAEEEAIFQAYEAALRDTAKSWRDHDIELKAAYCRASLERRTAEAEFNREDPEVEPARTAYQAAEKEFLEVEGPRMNPFWSRIAVAAISIAEIPLNAHVFRGLRESQAETYLLTGFIAVVLFVAAEWLGAALRHKDQTTIDRIGIFMAPGLLLFFLGMIAYQRAAYLGTRGGGLTSGRAVVFFLALNLAAFFIATMVATQGAHPEPARHKMLKAKRDAALQIFERESGEASAARQRWETAERTLVDARVGREKQFESYRAEADGFREACGTYVGLYRAANLRARSDGASPASFKVPPKEPDLPEVFRTALDWDCPGSGARQ